MLFITLYCRTLNIKGISFTSACNDLRVHLDLKRYLVMGKCIMLYSLSDISSIYVLKTLKRRIYELYIINLMLHESRNHADSLHTVLLRSQVR